MIYKKICLILVIFSPNIAYLNTINVILENLYNNYSYEVTITFKDLNNNILQEDVFIKTSREKPNFQINTDNLPNQTVNNFIFQISVKPNFDRPLLLFDIMSLNKIFRLFRRPNIDAYQEKIFQSQLTNFHIAPNLDQIRYLVFMLAKERINCITKL